MIHQKGYHHFFRLLLIVGILGCNNSANKPPDIDTSSIIHDTLGTEDSQHYFIMDTIDREKEWNEFFRVVNLLEFHTRDTMRKDSTYVATLYVGKNTTSAEMKLKVDDILEPGGVVKVRDTTQEITMHMKATLEDKAPKADPNFFIELLGGESNMRTYDEKKNKMVWQWNVTPRKEGNHQLLLSISHVNEEGKELGSPETRRHSIIIFSSQKEKGFFSKVGQFFANYWQWFLGAILLPIFIAWFTTRRREQASRDAGNTSMPANSNWKRKTRNRK
jgi:hypothetical protein